MNSTNSVSVKEFPKVRRECVESPKKLNLYLSGEGYEILQNIANEFYCGNISYAVEEMSKDKNRELFD